MLDPTLLRTFMLIAEGNRFSEVSRRLAIRQSTVSDHIRRLEECIGHKLFIRTTQSIAITPEGEALTDFARRILEINANAEEFFLRQKLQGRLRFGASGALTEWLPAIVKQFCIEHPGIDVDFTMSLSPYLLQRFDAGELDVILHQRRPGEDRGEMVLCDRLIWAKGIGVKPKTTNLLLHPSPSVTRSIVLDAIKKSPRDWRFSFTSENLGGIISAAKVGLGVAVFPSKLIPAGLEEVSSDFSLPFLGDIEFAILRSQAKRDTSIDKFIEVITNEARALATPYSLSPR